MLQYEEGRTMLKCPRCKGLFNRINHFVYKSGKDKMSHIGVCESCWSKARKLQVPKFKP